MRIRSTPATDVLGAHAPTAGRGTVTCVRAPVCHSISIRIRPASLTPSRYTRWTRKRNSSLRSSIPVVGARPVPALPRVGAHPPPPPPPGRAERAGRRPVQFLGLALQPLPLAKRLLPPRFQFGRDQPIGWIGCLVAASGDLDLIVGPLDLPLPLP